MTPGGNYVSIDSAPVDSLTDLPQKEFIEDLDAWTRRGHLQITAFVVSTLVLATVVASRAPVVVSAIVGVLALVALVAARIVELGLIRSRGECDYAAI